MKKLDIDYRTLRGCMDTLSKMNYKITYQKMVGVLSVRRGKVSAKLHIWRQPEGITLNLSEVQTYFFKDEAELQSFLERINFRSYRSEKEMQMQEFGMSEETWDIWNRGEEEDE